MMPQLSPSLAAASPALVKFGAKFLDKGTKLLRPWVRTQEYAPIVTGAVGFGMMYTDTYPDVARSIWDGSIAMLSDQILNEFYNLVKPANNPDNPGNPGNRKQITEGSGIRAETVYNRSAVRSVVEI